MSILSGSLPPSHGLTINDINAVADQMGVSLTLDRVIRLVTDEYDRRRIKRGKNGPDEDFTANTQKRGNNRYVECFHQPHYQQWQLSQLRG